MSNPQPELGKTLVGEVARDAIHIAIAPVVAKVKLKPGQHVGFVEPGNLTVVGPCDDPIGIVDPFLVGPVIPGQSFYMCMYPRTVQNLRHDWTHPSFVAQEAARRLGGVPESEEWIKRFAEDHGLGYSELLRGGKNVQQTGEWTDTLCANTETDVPDEFWDHFTRVTGVPANNRPEYIPCAC